MERAYFLLTGDGPEKQKILELEAKISATQTAWQEFADRYAPEGMVAVPYAGSRLEGVRFKPKDSGTKTHTIQELKRFAPENWRILPPKFPTTFKPNRKADGEAAKAFKDLPTLPSSDYLNVELGLESVYKGRRILFASGWGLRCGEVVMTCPINDKFEYYRPKGPCKVLSAKAHCDLMKREQAAVDAINAERGL